MPTKENVLTRTDDFIKWFLPKIERFPRNYKFLIGDRLVEIQLDVLENTARSHNSASYGYLRIPRSYRAPGVLPRRRRGVMVQDARHVYLEALLSPITQEFGVALEGLLGHQQVTDAYLLALARRHKAAFVTFDARVKHLMAPGALVEVLGQPV
jgi:predicted nucleic acid-binding protein